MLIKEWNDLPLILKTDEVRVYYDYLKKKKISLLCKRGFDIIASLILLILLSPVFIGIAIMIKIDSKGPVLFRQERVTQFGNKFFILKFRTMVEHADREGALVTSQNDVRITKAGSRIRNCRLDELPQLINVLKGEMSFVGTRPEVVKFVNAYTKEMYATLLLPAGITSLASIRYKDEGTILSAYPKDNIDQAYIDVVLSEKMKYNLTYLKEFSFINDIRLCLDTVRVVFKNKGDRDE